MEKLLAMSILSSATADINTEGWTKGWLKKESKSEKETTMRKLEKENERPAKVDQNEQQQRRIRFAQEFDGLDFFGTIVSR
ncbi:hypothetical protein QJS10_CPB20g01604 [Acorus calamus]|uniref:Uncharacterized protein n=1 Tax=Acorus calamus TaxID=4465 RepID=A0AAV9CBZ7_ACOCL|nr:hypothetical protein QJS10_CPB20g01604 [Acorus calamus]